ncbi:MAG: hypothetical protein AB7T01_11030 [Acidithiobacillus sp.]
MIRRGEIIPGTEQPLSDGVTAPVACVAIIDGERLRVVAKRIPQPAIEAEYLCAVLLREWGVAVPEPALLTDQQGATLFGSIHTNYPNLKQRLFDEVPPELQNRLHEIAANIVCSWDDAPTALAADELIANGDRNPGNLLWDGGDDHAYIDHERCLGLVPSEKNILAILALASEKRSHMELRSETFAFQSQSDGLPPLPAVEGELNLQWALDFLGQRMPNFGEMVRSRFQHTGDFFD